MKAPKRLPIDGSVSRGFEPVWEAFIENFTRRGELGGACCIYQDGEKVVDLWGGVRDRASGERWREDTMVLVHSTTKGLSAMVMALAHSRGWLDYDARVSTYWPEFAQNGKDRITVRQLLAHHAGLFAFDEPVDREVVADLDRLADVMARQRPAWEPGEREAYHAISLGFYEGELIRRIDPAHRSLGRVFDDEIAKPLGLDFYIGLPESIPDARLAPLEPPSLWTRLTGMPLPVVLASMNRRSVLYRSLIVNPGTQFYLDPHRVVARNLEVPSGGGVGTARALAKAYGVFANGGRELARRGFFDECFRGSRRARGAPPRRHGLREHLRHTSDDATKDPERLKLSARNVKGRRENRHHRARRSAAPMPCGWRRVGSSAPAASGLRAAPNCVTTWWSTHYPKVVVRIQPLG
jgi:CubicO group peptidase (beta-lactamase class C family)